MKPYLWIAVAAAALTIAAPALARGGKWEALSLTEKHKVVAAHVQHYRSVVQWWLHHRSPRGQLIRFVPARVCPSLDIRTPGYVCVAGQKLVHAIKVLRTLDAAIAVHAIPPPYTDWSVAVRFADHVFPGQYNWLWSCSGSEGGHGIWVWNGGAPYLSSSHGSGAGGWMQFLDSTFYNNVDAAFAEARSRGFPIPTSARSFASSVGQAITGAYMNWRGWSGQWYGAGC